MLINSFKLSVLVAVIIVLSGCARLKMQASIYHDPKISVANKTYAYYPLPTINQAASQQYIYFTQLIDTRLQTFGMKKTTLAKAQYGIILLYNAGADEQSISNFPLFGQTGKTITSSYTTGQYGRVGNTGRLNSQTSYTTSPSYGVAGMIRRRHTRYPYLFKFLIFKRSDIDYMDRTKKSTKPIYSAKLVAVAKYNNPDRAFPLMIQGLFKIFPGQNGQIQSIRVR